jgi:hypothetical protein
MIGGSHGGECEDGCVLCCSAALTGIKVYQRFRGPLYLQGGDHLDDGALRTSETLVNLYQSTRRYNLEHIHLHVFSSYKILSAVSRVIVEPDNQRFGD